MRIVLNLHKTKDMELYAWFMGIENRRSLRAAAIKSTWRDYLDGKFPARADLSSALAGSLMDDSLPKAVSFQVVIGKTDQCLAEYFGNIPAGLRAPCAKAILRIMTAPYALELFKSLPHAAESAATVQKEANANGAGGMQSPSCGASCAGNTLKRGISGAETAVMIPKVTPGRHAAQELPSWGNGAAETAAKRISGDVSGEESAFLHSTDREMPAAEAGNPVPEACHIHKESNESNVTPQGGITSNNSEGVVVSGPSGHFVTGDKESFHSENGDHLVTSDDDLFALFGVDYG